MAMLRVPPLPSAFDKTAETLRLRGVELHVTELLAGSPMLVPGRRRSAGRYLSMAAPTSERKSSLVNSPSAVQGMASCGGISPIGMECKERRQQHALRQISSGAKEQ